MLGPEPIISDCVFTTFKESLLVCSQSCSFKRSRFRSFCRSLINDVDDDDVENLTRTVDRYSASYEWVLITGDLNMEVTDKNLIPHIEAYELYSLIKKPICFKLKKGR